MTQVVLSSDVRTASGPGTVGAVPIVHSFGSRDARFRIDTDVRSVVDGGDLTSVGFALEFSEVLAFTTSNFIHTLFEIVPMGQQSLFQNYYTNYNWIEESPVDGLAEFLRIQWFIFGTGTADIVITLFDSETIIVQTFPSPTAGANVYDSAASALFRMDQLGGFTFFATLDQESQDACLVEAARRIEVEALCFLTGSAPISTDLELQTLLWGRTGARSNGGGLIDGILQSWRDAILLYTEEVAEAKILGEDSEEPAEDRGLVEIEIDAESAKYSERWTTEGAPGDFFHSRQKIWSLLSESFPFGGVR